MQTILKGLLLLTLISLTFSYPSIVTYSSYNRAVQETINNFQKAVNNITFSAMDLSKYSIPVNKTFETKFLKGNLTNLTPMKPIFDKNEISGEHKYYTAIHLNNNNNSNSFKFDLMVDYSLLRENDTSAMKGNGSIHFDVKKFDFLLAYDEDFVEYTVKPDLEIKFNYVNFTINNDSFEFRELESNITSDLANNRENIISTLEDIISEYLDRSIETYFKNSEKFTFSAFSLNNKAEQVALGITPLLLPRVESINNTNLGIRNYLDGKPYNLDGSKISRIQYYQDEHLLNKNLFDLSLNSQRQVFISYETFADLIKIDFKKDSEITVYENNVTEDIPFRFNVFYLNKFMPGLNYKFSNLQKFYVVIKIRDVKFNYNEDSEEKAYVNVKSDIFFKTAERNAGLTLLDISLDLKANLEIFGDKNSGYFNVKFASDYEILSLLPKNYESLEFYNDLFLTEFRKSYTITNLGKFDYQLFKYPVMFSDLIGENHLVKSYEKGVLLYERENVNRTEIIGNGKIEGDNKENLKFLE